MHSDYGEILETTDRDYEKMKKRAHELIAEYPEKKELFLGYLQSQKNEADDMQLALENVVWLLQYKWPAFDRSFLFAEKALLFEANNGNILIR